MTKGYPNGYGPKEARRKHWFLALVDRWYWSRRLYFRWLFGEWPPDNVVKHLGIPALRPVSDRDIRIAHDLLGDVGQTEARQHERRAK